LSGKPFKQVIKELASHFEKIDFPISIEINPHLNNPDEMVKEAKEYASYSKNFIIKIPCTEPGIIAAKKLAKDSIRVNMTLVFSASQALIAGKIGAYYVSPFIGWKESSGEPTIQYIKDVVQIYRNYNFKTQIIVAAVRNGNQIVEAAKANADIVTAGFDVYKESFYHPFTDLGLKRFCDAWDANKKRVK